MKTLLVLVISTLCSVPAFAYDKWSETPAALKLELSAAKAQIASMEKRLAEAEKKADEQRGKIIDLQGEARMAKVLENNALGMSKQYLDEKDAALRIMRHDAGAMWVGWSLVVVLGFVVWGQRSWYRLKQRRSDAQRPQDTLRL